jgi:hypothetical protein
MAPLLQIVIALVLLALCACLVPLILQMRRTARAVELLADSARQDLAGMAQDLHQVRARVDQVADLAAASLAVPASLGEGLSWMFRGRPEAGGPKAPAWLELIRSGLDLVLTVFLGGKEKKS